MAAGVGTRLRPLTCQVSKPMVPVANQPVLEHVFNLLKKHGITETVVNLHYRPDEITDYFGDGERFGMKIYYSREERLMGTAGGVKKVESHFTETFVVMSGDGLSDVDLTEAIKFHKDRKALATLVLKRVDYPLEYGVVIVDEEGRIKRFVEKPSWGEVFSNLANTGIYIFEPEVFKHIPAGEEYDFGAQLFPKFRENDMPIYGYVTESYWTDIGDIVEYRQAHLDALDGSVKVEIPGKRIGGNVWIGNGAQIDPNAILEGPVVIGENCVVEDGAKISESSVIGDNCVIGRGASIKRTVMWDNCHVALNSELRGCVIGSGVYVEPDVTVYEGAVIADNCVLGKSSVIKPNVKIWPSKIVETGTQLSTSLIWGEKWRRNIFGATGITGRPNVELTPEFITKVASAFGSCLSHPATVVVSSLGDPISDMMVRVIETGLISVGVNVIELPALPAAVTRFAVRELGYSGGIFVSCNQNSEEHEVRVVFFDNIGLNLDRKLKNKIEKIFFREEFKRALPNEVGSIKSNNAVLDNYRQAVRSRLDPSSRAALLRHILVGYDKAADKAGLLADILDGCVASDNVVTIQRNENGVEEAFGSRVRSAGVSLGLLVDIDNESVHLFDESGNKIDGQVALAMISKLTLASQRSGSVVAPVSASRVLDEIANSLYREVVRSKTNESSLMSESASGDVLIAGNGNGRFIFPQFQPVYDPFMSAAKIVSLFAGDLRPLSERLTEIPGIFMESVSLDCPWEKKGDIMEALIESGPEDRMELVDGVKIHQDSGGWVLLLPDPNEPFFHIFTEGDSAESCAAIMTEYRDRVQALIDK